MGLVRLGFVEALEYGMVRVMTNEIRANQGFDMSGAFESSPMMSIAEGTGLLLESIGASFVRTVEDASESHCTSAGLRRRHARPPRRDRGGRPGSTCVHRPRGGPLRYSNTRRLVWNPALSRADTDLQDITPHNLRHTCASLMRAAGTDGKVIQQQLGHRGVTVTLGTYTHLFEGDLDEVDGLPRRTFRDLNAS
jgi:hypothetical protein